jgi:mercuric ion binding protein
MFIKTKAIALLTVLLALPAAMPAWAKNYQIDVNGIVCEFCAFGIGKKLRKLPFIDPANFEDGVKVDIENQRVFVSVKAGEAVDQEALFDAIKSGGYDPINMQEMDEVASPAEVTQ